MDFGLGLVLSFTDNASVGMNNAVQSLSSLTSVAEQACGSLNSLDSTASLLATSQSASIIGDGFIKAGNGMLGMFNSLIAKTQSIGSEYENFGITLSALGMDSETALKKLFQFANKSPLEVGDVKEMIATLQAQGINAFEETTGAISHTRQEFLAYLTDLKSFKPEVANTRFKMAIQNYIGSGEKKMMRTVFDMGDIEKIIGHGVSDTAEGRMQDIVEMVENKGLTGLSKELSQSWQGVASNIDDAFTRIFYSVANDGGVFEKLKKSFVDLANIIIDLPEEDLSSLGKTIGDALNTIVTPLTKLVNWAGKAVKSMISLAQTNPALLKWGIVLTTISGIATVLTGVVFKLIGALASFTLVMQNIGGTVSQVSNLFKSGLSDMKAHILPLVSAVGLLAFVWATDFGGIRTMTLNFVNNISKSFATAKTNVEGSVQGLHESIKTLEGRDDFWSNITVGLMQLYGTFKFVAEAWNNYELSDDSFKKAEELGLIPLISRILDFKYRFEKFKTGFINGWKSISSNLQSIVSEMEPKLKGTMFESLIDGFTDLMTSLTNNDPKAWEDLGNKVANITFKVLALTIAIKLLKGTFGTVSSTIGVVSKLFGGFGKVISGLFSPITTLVTSLRTLSSGGLIEGTSVFSRLADSFALARGGAGTLTESLATMFPKLGSLINIVTKVINIVTKVGSVIAGIGAGPLLGVLAVLLTIVAFAVTQKDKFLEMIGSIKEHFVDAIEGIKENFQTGFNLIKSAVEPVITNIKDAISNLKASFSGFGEGMENSPIMTVLGYIGQYIMGNIVPIVNFLIDLVGSALGNAFVILSGIVSGVVAFIGNLFSGIVNVISGVINIISGIFSLDFEKIGTGIMQVIDGIAQAVGGLFGGIATVLGSIVTAFVDFGKDIVKGLIKGIKSLISNVGDCFKRIIDKVKDIFGIHSPSKIFKDIGINLMKGLFDGVKSLVSKVTDVFSSIGDKVSNTFSRVKDTVRNGMSNVKDTVSNTLNKVKGFFSKCKLSLPDIKVPHFKIKGGKIPWGIGGKGTKPEINIDWYAKGGVFNEPSVIGVGENGKEAVMPLEKNLGWISTLASMISSKMGGVSEPEVISLNTSSNNTNGSSNVVTKTVNNNTNSSTTNNTTTSGSVDNSIHFESGSIVIQAKEFSSSEAEKFAKLIMQKIQRMREINDMLQYKS